MKPSLGNIAKNTCMSAASLLTDDPLWVSQAAWLHGDGHLHLSGVLPSQQALAQTSNSTYASLPAAGDITASLQQFPEAGSGPRVTLLLSVLALKIYCHCLTVFHLFYQHSGHSFLFLQGCALPHSKITGNLLSHATDLLLL